MHGTADVSEQRSDSPAAFELVAPPRSHSRQRLVSDADIDAALEELSHIRVNQPPPIIVESHGKVVVRKLGLNGLGEFVRRWRLFFVQTLRPKYLPAGWSVDHFDMRPDVHPEVHATTGQMSRLPTIEEEFMNVVNGDSEPIATTADNDDDNDDDNDEALGPAFEC